LVLRATPPGLYLVGGAAGPLGGDDLALDVTIAAHASLAVRSAAATLAQPGPGRAPSTTVVCLTVDDHASLDWRLEPLVSVTGSDHRLVTRVTLHRRAQLWLTDEFVLGRSGEEPGRLRVRCRVDREGAPLVAHDLDLGSGAPATDSAAIVGDAGAVISTLVVGPVVPTRSAVVRHDDTGARAAWMPLADDAALLLAVGPTLPAARTLSRMLG
jgi:urease accessory protein